MLIGRALRYLLVAAAALAVGVSGQSCSTATECQEVVMTTTGGAQLTVTFSYLAGSGTICNVDYGTFNDNSGNQYNLVASSQATGDFVRASIQPGGTFPEGTNINLHFSATRIVNGVTQTFAGSLGSTDSNHNCLLNQCGGTTGQAVLVFDSIVSAPVNPPTSALSDQCTASAFGDPHLTGFHGQKYSVFGKAGGVINLLSSTFVQLNSRLTQLNDGDCLTNEQQTALQAANSELPRTHAFDYAGPYMSELGVAMSGGRKLYAQAGEYATGFAAVRLDDEDMAVGQSVVVGEGKHAVSLTRLSASELSVETRYFHVIVTNSDKFLNIEKIHLESGADSLRLPLGGAIGVSAQAGWKAHDGNAEWQAELEKASEVANNDLFALSASTKLHRFIADLRK